MATEFGVWLREQRMKCGLSSRELARQAGVSATYVSRLETLNEKCVPSAPTMKRLAAALNVDEQTGLAAAGRVPVDIVNWLLEAPESWTRLQRIIDQGVSIDDVVRVYQSTSHG